MEQGFILELSHYAKSHCSPHTSLSGHNPARKTNGLCLFGRRSAARNRDTDRPLYGSDFSGTIFRESPIPLVSSFCRHFLSTLFVDTFCRHFLSTWSDSGNLHRDRMDPEKRKARDSNPQPREGQLLSKEPANHSLTFLNTADVDQRRWRMPNPIRRPYHRVSP